MNKYATGIGTEPETINMVRALVWALRPFLVVETGCDVGTMTREIGMVLKALGSGRLITCDINKRSVNLTRERCQGLPVEVRLCSGSDLPELGEADFVFIDSSYESRVKEMDNLKVGALGVLHDWKENTDIKHRAKEFDEFFFIDNLHGVALLRRKG